MTEAIEAPAAPVPEKLKLAALSPVTASENDTDQLTCPAATGLAAPHSAGLLQAIVASGAVLSIVKVWPVVKSPLPAPVPPSLFVAASRTVSSSTTFRRENTATG